MAELKYIRGDATSPVGPGMKYIIHCCNDVGVWGSGFVIAISRCWTTPERAYRVWAEAEAYCHPEGPAVPFELGRIQLVPVEHDVMVVNMIGQHGCGLDAHGNPPIRYTAIQRCLRILRHRLVVNQRESVYPLVQSVHCPRFGAYRAGGDWAEIERLINTELVDKGVDVTVYDYPGAE